MFILMEYKKTHYCQHCNMYKALWIMLLLVLISSTIDVEKKIIYHITASKINMCWINCIFFFILSCYDNNNKIYGILFNDTFFVKESHVSINGTKQDKKESPMVCDGIWVGFLLSSAFGVFFVLPRNTSVLNLASICRSWSNNGRGLAQLAIWTDTFTKSLDLPS